MSSNRFLFHNGVVSPPSDTPTVSTFLESHPGAYTTTRTHNNASLLVFWERHLRRLTDSARILINSNPELFFKYGNPSDSISSPLMAFSRWESMIRSLVNDSVREVLPVALKERKSGEELAITALLSGNLGNLTEISGVDEERVSRIFDVYVHVGMYAPPVFGIQENGAHLALVGRGRDVADAKYSDWVRFRKPLERLRPPLTTELLLSNDGDQILEGCVTNLFVVCRKDHNDSSNGAKDINGYNTYPFEIQTAAIKDGVLPRDHTPIEVPPKLNRKFYRAAIRWAMLYETECWDAKRHHVTKMSVPEMRMLRWMRGKIRNDKIRNPNIRDRVEVARIEDKLRENTLRCFEHIRHWSFDAVVNKSDNMIIGSDNTRGRGRPKLALDAAVKK
ncbi:D-aminoacid aminotransferase-like PLP-dependent enzymes superfamily protein [Actinidia rufa]|uniref:D-aminoacid aminotransferase-like PLP-dependent enzymes superfamily protein n=1 Tax=Actinidia rufa TaxID=165716 RepID=A0A7J0DUY3_9ERIC|nr:D-aminoacid aminotransferase-like PLP-dependent enzymes superfamily protein [Actinidia rufa]